MSAPNKPETELYDSSVATGLYNLVLMIGCTGRLAHAVIIGSAMLVANLTAALVNSASGGLQPRRGDDFIQLILAAASVSLTYALSTLISPGLTNDLEFFYLILPVNIIGSNVLRRTALASAATTALVILRETGAVFGLLVAMAIFREPLGYGTVSLPGRDGLIILLASNSENSGIRVIASSAGAFIMIGYLFALFRKIQQRLYRGTQDQELM